MLVFATIAKEFELLSEFGQDKLVLQRHCIGLMAAGEVAEEVDFKKKEEGGE